MKLTSKAFCLDNETNIARITLVGSRNHTQTSSGSRFGAGQEGSALVTREITLCFGDVF